MNRQQERAAREQLDELKDSGRELDGFQRIEGRAAKAPRAMFSLRMGAGELEEISAAAEASEQNVSEFIRQAALARAREIATKGTALNDVRKRLRDLTESVDRL